MATKYALCTASRSRLISHFPKRATILHALQSNSFLVALLFIAGCTSPPPEDVESITWYAVNPGSTLRITLYDMVCSRQVASLRLPSRRETAVTTCADENGQAYVRYRPRGYASRMENWTYNRIRENQRVYMQ